MIGDTKNLIRTMHDTLVTDLENMRSSGIRRPRLTTKHLESGYSKDVVDMCNHGANCIMYYIK